MVNYCCVSGCGRNSRGSKHLYYYSIPKETLRQEQWLQSAGRTDLLQKPPDKRVLYRVCSRHFSPSSFKNKHLCADAVPTLCLPGSGIEGNEEDLSDEKPVHPNISCDSCGNNITGFRYKCVSCTDYDLCSRCEMTEAHSQHYMLRIPKPAKLKTLERMVKKLQELPNENVVKDDSSDDEPITKYVSKNYDSGVDLTEDIKESIRKEVTRVLNQKPVSNKTKKTATSRKRPAESDKSSKIKKTEMVDLTEIFVNAPEVVFADVNEIHSVGPNQMIDVKAESSAVHYTNMDDPGLPLLQMKLSDDLSELMM